MRDLKRLLRYIKPHWQTFALATFAMFLVALLEIAIRSLVVPIFDQALTAKGGQRTQILFGLPLPAPKWSQSRASMFDSRPDVSFPP